MCLASRKTAIGMRDSEFSQSYQIILFLRSIRFVRFLLCVFWPFFQDTDAVVKSWTRLHLNVSIIFFCFISSSVLCVLQKQYVLGLIKLRIALWMENGQRSITNHVKTKEKEERATKKQRSDREIFKIPERFYGCVLLC